MTNGLYELFWQVPTGLTAIDYDLMFGVDCEYRVWDSTGQTLADAQDHNWSSESPNNITNLTSGNFVAGNWIRFKIITPNFVDGGLKVFYQTGTSASTVTLTVDVNTIDQDFLIPISKDVSSFSITPASGDVYVELRTDSPSVENYCLYPATVYDLAQNATLLAAINAAFASNADAKVALHIWVVDRPTTVDLVVNFVDGSVYNSHTNHNQNLKYPEQLKGRDQVFDGLTDFDYTVGLIAPQKTVAQVWVMSFYYNNNGSGQTLFVGTKDAADNFPHYQFSIRPDDSTTILMRSDFINPKQNQWISSLTVNEGYNTVIIVKDAGYTGASNMRFFINGHEDTNLSFVQAGAGVTAGDDFTQAKNYTFGRISDLYQIPTDVTGSYFNGKLKILQWIDLSSFALTDEIIRKIYNQKSAREIIPNSNYVLDFEATSLSPTDLSPSGYTLTPFGGYVSNPEFLDF